MYNEAGVSQNQFNSDGNLALTNSILNDAATMYNLVLQFEIFLNDLIEKYNTKPKKVDYQVQILPTTIYNYQELAKLYKEQTQLGYSKVLPQVALGQTQSSVIANGYFENKVMHLDELFIPPQMSSTMSNKAPMQNGKGSSGNASANSGANASKGGGAGRPEKPDSEKSEKTIKNKESES